VLDALALCLSLALVAGDAKPIAFVDVNLVSMEDDRVRPHQTVVVRGDRVASVGDAATASVPADAVRIEGSGRFLLPGLADMHVHVRDAEDFALYLAAGVTTVRNLDGDVTHLAWRREIAEGRRLAPTLVTSGPIVVGVHSVADAEKLVADEAAAGYEEIKIYDDVTVQAYRALVDAARRHGLRPVGHVPRNLKLDVVLAARPDAIDHAEEFLYSRFLPKLDASEIPEVAHATREAGISVTATLVTYDTIGRQVADVRAMLDRAENRYAGIADRATWGPGANHYLKAFSQDKVPMLRERLAFQEKLVRGFRDAGVRLLAGTDAGGVEFVLPGWSLHEELALLVRSGLTPYEALRAATRDAQDFLGKLADAGTVAAGKRADLLLVKGNPLDDVSNAALRAGVMVRGRWLPEDELRTMLDDLARRRASDDAFFEVLTTKGVAEATLVYEAATRADPKATSFVERTLNALGYRWLRDGKRLDDAVAVFALNARAYPDSWNAWDSLGEAQLAAGRASDAAASYRRSLDLYPANTGAADALKKLAAK
jgi:imidazolonepropionase-like amidohydrolase